MVKRSSFMTPLSLSLFLLLIIITALQLEASVPMKTFHYVGENKNWYDARQLCKEKLTDLASAASHREGLLKELRKNQHGWPHIGLYRDAEDPSVWRWTRERGDASSDTNWAPAEPKNDENCGVYTGELHGVPCFYRIPFICFTDNVVLVKENKTWEEALEHCRAIGSVHSRQHNHYREHQYDLVSLQSEDDHRYARDKIQEASTNEV